MTSSKSDVNRHRERRRLFFAEMLGSNACTVTPFGRTVDVKFRPFREERTDMTVATPALSHRLRPLMAAICLSASLGVGLGAASI